MTSQATIKAGLLLRLGAIMLSLLWFNEDAATAAAPRAEAVAAKWQDFTSRFVERPCWFLEPGEAAPSKVRCGTVKVPEDRTEPSSGMINIAVMTISSERPPAASGALLWIDSGPGFAGISARRVDLALDGSMAPFRRTLDLVLFDQRGTGYSDRNVCRSIPDAYTYGVRLERGGDRRFRSNMRRCLDDARDAGVPIRAYSDWQIALDARDIRRALAIRQWNLFSYLTSTGIAQAIMQVDAGGVRAAVLDSPAPNGREEGIERPEAASLMMDRTLRRLSERCRQEPGCAAANGNFHKRVLALLDDYERRPLIIDGLDPDAATYGRLVLDDRIAATFLMFMLYNGSSQKDLPAVLDALEDRDVGAVRTYARAWFSPSAGRNSQLTRYAIKCRTNAGGMGVSKAALRRAEREAPGIYRRLGLFRYADDCATFDFGPPDPSVRTTHFSGPVLVADGVFDPVNSVADTRRFAASFPKGQIVLFANGGVTPLLDEFANCGGEIVRAFFDSPGTSVDDRCARKARAMPFLTSYHRTSAPGALLSAASRGTYPIPSLVLLAGLAVGFVVLPLVWLSRRAWTATRVHPGVPRPELLAWVGASLTVAACVSLALILRAWAVDHLQALPAAVPMTVFASAGLAALGMVFALVALLRIRRRGAPVGGLTSDLMAACLSLLTIGVAVRLVALL